MGDTIFDDVGEELQPPGEGGVHLVRRVEDEIDRGLYPCLAYDLVFDRVPV